MGNHGACRRRRFWKRDKRPVDAQGLVLGCCTWLAALLRPLGSSIEGTGTGPVLALPTHPLPTHNPDQSTGGPPPGSTPSLPGGVPTGAEGRGCDGGQPMTWFSRNTKVAPHICSTSLPDVLVRSGSCHAAMPPRACLRNAVAPRSTSTRLPINVHGSLVTGTSPLPTVRHHRTRHKIKN